MEHSISINVQGKTLSAVLHLPKKGRHAVVAICHGFMGSKIGMHRLFVKAARSLAEEGYAVMRFDYSGCGESSGEHRNLTLHKQVCETIAVIDYLHNHPSIDSNNISIIGHSMGGCVAALTAASDVRVRRLILWAPVARPFEDLLAIVGRDTFNETMKIGTSHFEGFELSSTFFDSLRSHNPLEEVLKFRGDYMIVHGTADSEVNPRNAASYYEALVLAGNSRGHLLEIPDADHTFAAPLWEKEVTRHTIKFLQSDNVCERHVV